MVGAVLGGEGDLGALEGLGDAHQVGERRGDDELDIGREVLGLRGDGFGEFNAFGNGGVHLPVAGNDILSHISK